jgi:hypothetical protein
MSAEDFPNAAFATIPDHSLAQFAGGGDPKSQLPSLGRQNKGRKVGAMKAKPLVIGHPELLAGAQFARGF